jgi:hypothetical protein
MALSADELATKIMDKQKELTESAMSDDDTSKTDEDLAKEGKIRVDYENKKMILDTKKLGDLDYIEPMGQVIVDYIKENTEFVYALTIIWQIPGPNGTTPTPDPLIVLNTAKISSIKNNLKGKFSSVPEFLLKIENSIMSAVIDLGSPNEIFTALSKDKFGSIKIIYTPVNDWETNMKNLATGIVNAVKLGISLTSVSCTDTVPPAVSSSGTAQMTTIF